MRNEVWERFVVLVAACASPRSAVGPGPAAARPVSASGAFAVRVPVVSDGDLRTALFYSDLGPDAVDVSGYPAQQRHNYAVYARTESLGRSAVVQRRDNGGPRLS